MTILVAFNCTDGVVIGADSMLTLFAGNDNASRRTSNKMYTAAGNRIFAYAGRQDNAELLRVGFEANPVILSESSHPIDYPCDLIRTIHNRFLYMGVPQPIDVHFVLAYEHNDTHHCCIFNGMSPFLLTEIDFFSTIGSGADLAEVFLKFMVNSLCPNGRPNVKDGRLLATWAILHLIQTSAGGIDGPIHIAVLEKNAENKYSARKLQEYEIVNELTIIRDFQFAMPYLLTETRSGSKIEEPELPPSI